jgi:molybdopterin-guanine dinucleotide biosynthesis protein A
MRGVILAGGGSTRFGGTPKGLLEVGGRRILDRVAAALVEAFGSSPLLIANAPAAAEWRLDLETVADRRRAAGALGGLDAAVRLGPAPVVVVAWDLPFVTGPLLRRLAEGLAGFDAFLPESGGPRGLEPLCAAYGPATAGPIEAAIDRGDLRAVAFHPAVNVGRLGSAEVARYGDPAQLFFNVNTPADLATANRLARESRP